MSLPRGINPRRITKERLSSLSTQPLRQREVKPASPPRRPSDTSELRKPQRTGQRPRQKVSLQTRPRQNIIVAPPAPPPPPRRRINVRNRLRHSIVIQIPTLQAKPKEKYPEDTLDTTELRIQNNQFVPVESDGISVFRPEILSIVDFKPIWKGNNVVKRKRYTKGLSPAGKLIDIQYSALWMRRDTIVRLLNGMQDKNTKNTAPVFENLKRNFQNEIKRTERTVNSYTNFINKVNFAKSTLNIRKINRASFSDNYLPIPDFFAAKMQINEEEFEIYSDTKILMQLLTDFKAIAEGYSFSLLDLVDSDRLNDRSPIDIDTTYTSQDGFTFSVEQLRSEVNPINAMERDFFNKFLNSLPPNPDDRVKLLLTILSKELRVSKGLGKKINGEILSNIFDSTNTGNPFDNIIGIPGDTIFDLPLGTNSLSSVLVRKIDDNNFVLPFERKYVDTEDSKQTYVPGSTFFVDSVFNLDGNKFNTRPFINYASELTKKFSSAKRIISNLFEFSEKESPISPKRMVDALFLSYERSISDTTTTSGLNREQVIIMALFSLANEDNKLKSLLFQFLLLVGLAQNTKADTKPIFTFLANELKTINSIPDIDSSRTTNVNIFVGIRTLYPFLERLASDIENRVFTLTTVAPKTNIRTSFSRRSRRSIFNRFRIVNDQNSLIRSSFDRFTAQPLLSDQETTVNIQKENIKNVLMSSVETRSSVVPTMIKEFVDLANRFNQGAAVNGENVYLLEDNSGRTRFNFISTSTQMLVLFEIISSMVSKYNFSKFVKSQTISNVFIKVDTKNNKFIKNTIDEIVNISKNTSSSENSFANSTKDSFRPKQALVTRRAQKRPDSISQRLNEASKITVSRTASSSTTSNKTSISGGSFSLISEESEKDLINTKINSPFLGQGNKLASKLGIVRIDENTFSRKPARLKSSLRSIRNKIIEESEIKKNILEILSVIQRRVQSGAADFYNGFDQRSLNDFLKENSISDLEVTRTPAQVRQAKFSVDEMLSKRISNTAERIATDDSDKIAIYSPEDETKDIEKRDTALNSFVDEETITPDTREALLSYLSEPLFLEGNLADIRTKIITIGIPGGFTKQLSDRVLQSAITETAFRDKQFDVISINIYRRDARFDDIVFKPQTFLFDLSLFAEDDFSYLRTRKNENFSRILQRVRVRDLENPVKWRQGSGSDSPVYRNVGNIINDDKYDFLTNEQKRTIIANHTGSSLLQTYIRMLSGLRIDETTFVKNEINPGTNFAQDFEDLVLTYLRKDLNKNIPNQPIASLINNPNIDDESKDILRLFTYGGTVFEPATFRNRTISPKLFDRVFHIAFNTEDFEIDIDSTNETQTGKAALSQNFVQERLVTIGDAVFLKARNRNEIAFDDFFVSIENDI